MSAFYQPGDEPVAGYRLLAHLGQGGFGDVWKATAPGGFEVALKIIRLDRKQGQREFRALKLMKRVRHANLVPIMALWLKDEEGNIVEDAAALPTRTASPEEQTLVYEEGTPAGPDEELHEPAELIIAMGLGSSSLNSRLDQCKAEGLDGIPSDELLRYMEDSARAIDYLNSPTHDLSTGEVSIQHGDVKPHNILIVGGTAQVCDFGLARVMGAGTRTTSVVAMTIAYASPETLLNNQPSQTSDLYSLAITYVDLRTGALPFGSETLPGVTRAIAKGNLDLSRLPPPERSVIRRATAFDPNRRYQTTVEMVKDLRTAVEDKKGVRTPVSKRQKAAIALACSILVLTVILVWALSPDGPEGERDTTSANYKHTALSQEHLDRGTKYLKSEEYAKAVEELSIVIEIVQGDPKPFSRRANAYLNLIDYPEAIADYTKALELDEHAVEYHGRGTAHFRAGHLPEALADFNAADEIVRDNPQLKEEITKAKARTLDAIKFVNEQQKQDQDD